MVDADFNFKMPKIEMTEKSEDGKYGKFVVEPLERGYGLTLGNSLRRIMLSSLVGTAVSSIKIEGVLHEFSSIPGVAYANGADIKMMAQKTFAIMPRNVGFSGVDLMSELENNGYSF